MARSNINVLAHNILACHLIFPPQHCCRLYSIENVLRYTFEMKKINKNWMWCSKKVNQRSVETQKHQDSFKANKQCLKGPDISGISTYSSHLLDTSVFLTHFLPSEQQLGCQNWVDFFFFPPDHFTSVFHWCLIMSSVHYICNVLNTVLPLMSFTESCLQLMHRCPSLSFPSLPKGVHKSETVIQ